MKDNKSIEFIVQNGNARKHFVSIEEFKKWAKGKMPNSGDKWILHEVITETKVHEIESERKCIYDQSIVNRILTEFIEKANTKNVNYDEYETTVTDPKYLNIKHNQLIPYKIAEDIGYSWDKLDDFFKNKDNVLNNRLIDDMGINLFEEYLKESSLEKALYCCDWQIAELANFWVIKDKFNIADEDINLNMVWGYAGKNYEKRKIQVKYPEAYEFVKSYEDYSYPSRKKGLVVELTPEEKLAAYKKRIKEYPWDKVKVFYNIGDYKPCHNYKIEFPQDFDPHKELFNTYNPIDTIPGIMFRDKDIYVTNSNYIGRHVNHRTSKQCDVDEKLYEYCTKNLK